MKIMISYKNKIVILKDEYDDLDYRLEQIFLAQIKENYFIFIDKKNLKTCVHDLLVHKFEDFYK